LSFNLWSILAAFHQPPTHELQISRDEQTKLLRTR
jgi:hypothetical protein